jgi:hypothetical protein
MASHRVGLVRRVALGLSVVLVAGALGFPASAEDAFEPDGPRTFRAVVSGPASGPYSLTLTNTATGNKTLGSANITIPGFTIGTELSLVVSHDSVEPPLASAVLEGQTIELRDLGLLPEHTASLTFTGAPAIDNEVCEFPIDIDARQANNFQGTGNALSLFGPSPLLVSCEETPDIRLVFLTQPDDAITNEVVPGNGGEDSFPQVALVDDGGALVNAASLEVTLTILGGEPNASAPGFEDAEEATKPMVSGVATFDQLRISPGGFGYKLRATAGDDLAVESISFNVYDDECAPPESCTASIGEEKVFSATATGVPGPDGGGLILNVGGPLPATGDCTFPSGVKVTRIPQVGISATGVGLTDKLLVLTLDRSYDKSVSDNDGVAHYQICARSSEPTSEFSLFTDRYGDEVPLGSWGYLPDCRDSGDRPPCVLSRTKSQGGFPVITLRWGSRMTLG